MALPAPRYITFEEYLIAETNDASTVRHEWVDGYVVAMSGATPEHGALCAAMLIALGNGLRGRGCTVRDGSTSVHVPVTRAGLRPDISVVCGETQKTVVTKNDKVLGAAITNRCVLVEVLSESTEVNDRGWKFRDYRGIPALEEYVLVSQEERRIEVYRRARGWQCDMFGAGEAVDVHGVNFEVDAIYGE